MQESAPPPSRSDARFATTPWATVQRAQADDTPEATAALERLCRAYWAPVYAFIRRRGYGRADAEDLTQAFLFALIQEGFWRRANPAQGRFRGYLAGALRMFLSDERARTGAWKRGGRAEWVPVGSLDQLENELGSGAGDGSSDPAALFEQRWAHAIVARAVQRLEEEQNGAGRARQFRALQRYLAETPERGDYARVAAELGTTRTTVAVWMHRLHQRLAELVQLEVAETVADPALVKEEVRHVLCALSGRGAGAER